MTLESIIRNGKGSAGSNGAWKVRRHDGGVPCWPIFTLTHYSTTMLCWYDGPNGRVVTTLSTGHGSVSDQNGMNKAFRVLDLPYYYSRKGGAEIVEVSR